MEQLGVSGRWETLGILGLLAGIGVNYLFT